MVWPQALVFRKNVLSQLNISFYIKILDTFQSGFSFTHSIETAFLRVTNDLSNAGIRCILVLLDIIRALNTIDQEVLLICLRDRVGVSGLACNLFKSHLSTEPS